jgi:anaerobic ribonucleoside-triphosphate reductase activating protein
VSSTSHELRVNSIVAESIVDGPGLRYVVFTQGCPHRCHACHNPQTHDVGGGYLLDVETIIHQFDENPLLAGITFSGGEPFLQPDPLCVIAKQVRRRAKTVVVFSGFTIEALNALADRRPAIRALLSLTDILIDGPYIDSLRDLSLPFRGSRNQRVLTRETGFLPPTRAHTPDEGIAA